MVVQAPLAPRAATALALGLCLAALCGCGGTPPAAGPTSTAPPASRPASVPSAIARANGPTPYSFLSVAMADPRDGYALATGPRGKGIAVLVTTTGGARWRPVKTLADGRVYQQDIVAPDTAHADFVSGSVIAGTSNGGRSWTTLYRAPAALQALSFTHAADGWALGTVAKPNARHGVLLRTTDGGVRWTALRAPCNPQASGALSFVNATDGWASCLINPGVGRSPKTIYATSDGGVHWKAVATTRRLGAAGPSPTDSGLNREGYPHALFFLNRKDGWFAVDNGGYFATTDGGVNWHSVWFATFPPGYNAPSVGMLRSGFGWAVTNANPKALGNALYVTHDHGAHWHEVYP